MNEEDNTENFITDLSHIPYANLIECLDDHDVDAIVYNKIAEEMYNEFNYILSEIENELIENQNTDFVALGVINSVLNYIEQNEFGFEYHRFTREAYEKMMGSLES